ncbi:unnamed protein product [Prorocentrum cordatum]|uniref:Uncharacterized protein n=1 Tax=Prorocentrum cordatum TaxID=2364126 RepID=A0ABN9QT01_9DINO|nr:unnamed protein product [Polarella glacialis]
MGEPAAECPYAARTNHYGLTNRRMGGDVPGYTGFIPGKHSEQVLGTTFANSNANAQDCSTALRRPERAPHLPEGGPMCWSGSHAALVSAGSVAPLGAPQA